MKYFLLKHTEKIPAMFGGETYGPLIKIRPKYAGDTGLLEHEKIHVRQWYGALLIGFMFCSVLMLYVSSDLWPLYVVAPCIHQLFYKFVRPYRRWCEVKAYRGQIATGSYISNEFAVTMLVEKYDLGLSVDQARTLLID